MQLIFQNDHVVINLVGVLFGGCYRRSYFELCVCARGQWKVRILRIREHAEMCLGRYLATLKDPTAFRFFP